MHILLPPSESKRDGGVEGTALDLQALSFAGLNPTRRSVLAAVRALSSNRAHAASALGLSVSQYFEVDRNRAIRRAPVMPAIDRYSGVLYDALDAATLPPSAREFAAGHVVIHSAMFGLLGGLDPIPAYRLSHDSRLPKLPLKRAWRDAVSGELGKLMGFIVDLRSEAYVALGAAPASSVFLRVVSVDANGTRRALNHFNKKAKGELLRELLLAQIVHPDAASLTEWAIGRGIQLVSGDPGELQLVV